MDYWNENYGEHFLDQYKYTGGDRVRWRIKDCVDLFKFEGKFFLFFLTDCSLCFLFLISVTILLLKTDPSHVVPRYGLLIPPAHTSSV